MSKFDEELVKYQAELDKLNIKINADLLKAVSKGLGPSIYRSDASKVSASSADELKTIKNNFLIKKLGLPDGPDLDKALDEVIEKMGRSNRNKYRAVFYSLLVTKFKKENLFK